MPNKSHPVRRRIPSQDRSRSKVEDILAAAARVLEDEGYHAATTRKIATQAGVGIGTVYEYFTDKEDIVTALINFEVDKLTTRMAAELSGLGAPSMPTVARAFFRTLLRTIYDRTELTRVLFGQFPGLMAIPAVRDLDVRFDHGVRELLLGVAATDRSVHPDVVVFLVTNAIKGVVSRAAAGVRTNLPADDLADELVRLVVSYLQLAPDRDPLAP